jgi:antitoxin VapB
MMELELRAVGSETIMQTARVISHGICQSVQLPEGFHIDGNEVYVKHLGKSVLLIPKDADPWDLMADSLDRFTDDFMLERLQPPPQQREGLGA